MDNNTYNSIIKVLDYEVRFYSDKNNSDWSKEKTRVSKRE